MENIEDRFWEMVDQVNWIRNPIYNNSEELVLKYISPNFSWEEYIQFSELYKKYYGELSRSLFNHWISLSEYSVSDDGYTDVISSMIGSGKNFYYSSFSSIDLFINMIKSNNYRENFGYLFHYNYFNKRTKDEFKNKYLSINIEFQRNRKLDEILKTKNPT